MKLLNRYRANCWDCGRPVFPGQGMLIGKDAVVGWWMTRCLVCDKKRVVIPGFFDQEIDDEGQADARIKDTPMRPEKTCTQSK